MARWKVVVAWVLGVGSGMILMLALLSTVLTPCRTETAVLFRQYLADEDPVGDFVGCTQCLHMDVVVIDGNRTYGRTYFFAYEHELKPWKVGSLLEVRWCRVDPIDDVWAIRGVRVVKEPPSVEEVLKGLKERDGRE